MAVESQGIKKWLQFVRHLPYTLCTNTPCFVPWSNVEQVIILARPHPYSYTYLVSLSAKMDDYR